MSVGWAKANVVCAHCLTSALIGPNSGIWNNGATLYEVQKLLGHSRSEATERYANLANHRLQQAVSLIDKAYE